MSTITEQTVRLAIPNWNGRVSPVFDTARRLVVIDVARRTEQRRQVVEAETDSFPARRVRRLGELQIDVLICGAISRSLAELVTMAGVVLVPWVIGPVDDVPQAYLARRLSDPRWRMPGYRGQRIEPRTDGVQPGNLQDG
jgi:predicted Fe-Mo cluster-binding NifX family protein